MLKFALTGLLFALISIVPGALAVDAADGQAHYELPLCLPGNYQTDPGGLLALRTVTINT